MRRANVPLYLVYTMFVYRSIPSSGTYREIKARFDMVKETWEWRNAAKVSTRRMSSHENSFLARVRSAIGCPAHRVHGDE